MKWLIWREYRLNPLILIVGAGLQIRTADLNGNGRLDILVAGKSGTDILFNEGQ